MRSDGTGNLLGHYLAAMKPAKIVHLTSVHSAFDNRIFRKECRSLARAGFQVTIVAPHTGDECVEGVHIKAVPIHAGRGRLRRMTYTAWNVYREALRQEGDLYHFHDPELIPAGLLLRARGKRVIYDIHENVPKDILLKEYLPWWSRRVLSWMIGKLETSAGRQFSALITVSPPIAERFVSYNPRTVLIHNFPDPVELAGAERTPWQMREPAVAFPGGILPERGIRQMIHAMAHLPESSKVTLEIASDDFPEDLRRELSQHPGWARVRYRGRLNRAQIVSLLGRVSAGLVLYLPEEQNLCAMPHKLFEYMAAGIPMIASNFPLWRELLRDVDCAVFVDPLRPEAIAEAIQYVLANPAEAESMGRRGQQAVRESYNWDSQARELCRLYTNLMEPACAE